jgi:hypothetical protein
MAEIRTRKLKAENTQTGVAAPSKLVQYSYRASLADTQRTAKTKLANANHVTPDAVLFNTEYIFSDLRQTARVAIMVLLLLALIWAGLKHWAII